MTEVACLTIQQAATLYDKNPFTIKRHVDIGNVRAHKHTAPGQKREQWLVEVPSLEALARELGWEKVST